MSEHWSYHPGLATDPLAHKHLYDWPPQPYYDTPMQWHSHEGGERVHSHVNVYGRTPEERDPPKPEPDWRGLADGLAKALRDHLLRLHGQRHGETYWLPPELEVQVWALEDSLAAYDAALVACQLKRAPTM